MSQVGDYNIANASGASVRSDINAVLDAIKTFNSGGSDPANPEAFMPYVDTADSNKLKIRNASNNGFTTVGSVNEANLGLLPRAGGTMTGQLLGDDSSVAGSPAYAFDNDTDTGMFRSAANQVAFTCAGTKISHFSSAGLFITSTGSATTGIFLNDADNSAHISLKSPDTLSSSITYKLPGTIVNGGFLKTDSSGNLSFATPDSVPTGCVFCRAAASVPAGYLECNGAAVSRSTYSALFAVIGTTYGSGNGSSTFNLPDLRGEFVRGFDNGRGVDSGRSINNPQGSANQSHNHSYGNAGITVSGANHRHNARGFSLQPSVASVAITLGSGQSYQIGYRTSDSGSTNQAILNSGNLSMSGTVGITINNTGGNESRPRNVAMMYIIRI
jgi:microcystin-dependent protein